MSLQRKAWLGFHNIYECSLKHIKYKLTSKYDVVEIVLAILVNYQVLPSLMAMILYAVAVTKMFKTKSLFIFHKLDKKWKNVLITEYQSEKP